MSTSNKGDELEVAILNLLQAEIDNDRFFAKRDCCRVFRQKGYYSKDRESDIVFDISIEIRYPGADDYSVLFLVECKNYEHPVPASDLEEFHAKVDQVGADNTKAVIITSRSYQAGAIAYAKSKKMGLVRYFAPDTLKWDLRRSPSAGSSGASSVDSHGIESAMVREGYRSSVFDLYLLTNARGTNSLWSFFEDMIVDSALSKKEFRAIHNARGRRGSVVPFVHRSELEARARAVLEEVGYQEGYVNLDRLHAGHSMTRELRVERRTPPVDNSEGGPLGRVSFDPPLIELYTDHEANRGRDRFTFAHELAHVLLGHDRYMRSETCDEGDFRLQLVVARDENDISRMEYQANYFAASLIMPTESFVTDFAWELGRLGLTDKGRGPLYVDDQECNVTNYMQVTSRLMTFYGASRSAVAIRLEGLGLMRDVRRSRIPSSKEDISWVMVD